MGRPQDSEFQAVASAIQHIGNVPGKRFEVCNDFKGKVIRAFYDGDKEATSPIKYMESSGSQLILQGVENDHGWSLAVHRESGRMNVGVSGSEVSFSLFGACQVL